MADQNQTPNNDSVNPLFNKMDALMARHRNGPAASLDDIPVLTEEAPKPIPSLFDVVDDIPSLTDVVEPNLAAKIANLELEWAIDHREPDIGHLDDEIIAAPASKAKPSSLTIDPLPFQKTAQVLTAATEPLLAATTIQPAAPEPAAASAEPDEYLSIPRLPEAIPRSAVHAPEPAFLDLPMLDLDELTREPSPDYLDLPLLDTRSKRDLVSSSPSEHFIATDLTLTLDDLPSEPAPALPDFAHILAETSRAAAEVPHLDLDAILAPEPPANELLAAASSVDDCVENIPTLDAEPHEPSALTAHTQIEPSLANTLADDELEISIEFDNEPSEAAAYPFSEDTALAQQSSALSAEIDEPIYEINLDDDFAAELAPAVVAIEPAASNTTQPSPPVESSSAPTLIWDDEPELVIYSGNEIEAAAINLDTLEAEQEALLSTETEPLNEAPSNTPASISTMDLPDEPVDDIPPSDQQELTRPSAEIIEFPLNALNIETALPTEQPPKAAQVSADTVAEITATVGAQLAIDMASEIEQLTKQHFSALMNQFYGETLRKLTEEISRDLEERLAPRIAELVESELRSKKLLD